MPIDIDRALGAALPGVEYAWDPADIILYHLGVGAGAHPDDARELEYVYEPQLKVLPSFAVLPAFEVLSGTPGVDGLDIDPAAILHGEQDLEIHALIPTTGRVRSDGRVVALYDKGSAAVLVVETTTVDAQGTKLFTNRFTAFLRGEGGFGGPAGPAPGNEAPHSEPTHVAESTTLPQQALLYRLSCDLNPLHVDPDVATRAGFPRPILHGLCSYGIVAKAVVDTVLAGDVSRLVRYQARFSGVVYPGETIVTKMWVDGGRVIVSAGSKERDTPVLTHAAITIR